MKLVIDVTQEDIDHAKECFCPVEHAFHRILGNHETVVGPADLNFYTPLRWYGPTGQIPLPPIAQEFIKRYDEQRPVEPFTFEVDYYEVDYYV
jgi:hypothetical protein